jgi:hypothetical protein
LHNDAVFLAPVEVCLLPLICRADAELDTAFASHKSQRGATIAEDVVQEPKNLLIKFVFKFTRAKIMLTFMISTSACLLISNFGY